MAWYISRLAALRDFSGHPGNVSVTCFLRARTRSVGSLRMHALVLLNQVGSLRILWKLSLTRPQSSLGFLWMGDSPWRREWMELLGETEGTHTKLQPGSNLLLVSISDLRSPLSKLPSLENFKRCTRKSVIGCFPHARTRSSWLAVDRGGGLIFLHHLSHVFANVRYAIPIYTYCSPFLI